MWIFDCSGCGCCRPSRDETSELKVDTAITGEPGLSGTSFESADERKAVKEMFKSKVKQFISESLTGIQIDLVTGDLQSASLSPALLKLEKSLKAMNITVFNLPGTVARIPFDNINGEIDRTSHETYKCVPEGSYGVRVPFKRVKDACFFSDKEDFESFTIITKDKEKQQRFWACLQIIRALQEKIKQHPR